jgi:hypothetical protein
VVSGGAPTAGTAGAAGSASDLPCARSGDCSGGQVCGERRADGRLYCTAPATGGGALGAACTTGPTTTECHDRVCLVGVSSQCSRPCVDDEDCADASGFVCTNVGAAFRFCMQGCQAPADCRTGLDCALSPSVTADRWDFVCQLPYGPVASGGDCTLVNNCGSGLCLYGANGLNYCTSACSVADDCPASLGQCASVMIGRPVSGTTQPVMACVVPAATN